MFNAIDEVKRQYTYAVQPVKLFEANHSQAAQKYALDFEFLNQMNKITKNNHKLKNKGKNQFKKKPLLFKKNQQKKN